MCLFVRGSIAGSNCGGFHALRARFVHAMRNDLVISLVTESESCNRVIEDSMISCTAQSVRTILM